MICGDAKDTAAAAEAPAKAAEGADAGVEALETRVADKLVAEAKNNEAAAAAVEAEIASQDKPSPAKKIEGAVKDAAGKAAAAVKGAAVAVKDGVEKMAEAGADKAVEGTE